MSSQKPRTSSVSLSIRVEGGVARIVMNLPLKYFGWFTAALVPTTTLIAAALMR